MKNISFVNLFKLFELLVPKLFIFALHKPIHYIYEYIYKFLIGILLIKYFLLEPRKFYICDIGSAVGTFIKV